MMLISSGDVHIQVLRFIKSEVNTLLKIEDPINQSIWRHHPPESRSRSLTFFGGLRGVRVATLSCKKTSVQGSDRFPPSLPVLKHISQLFLWHIKWRSQKIERSTITSGRKLDAAGGYLVRYLGECSGLDVPNIWIIWVIQRKRLDGSKKPGSISVSNRKYMGQHSVIHQIPSLKLGVRTWKIDGWLITYITFLLGYHIFRCFGS